MREGRLPLKDFVKDTLSAIKMSGRRSFLSGAVTVWGVFIFMVIAGTGNGIDKGNRSNYDFLLQYGIISIYPGEISTPVNGLGKGRKLSLHISDADEMKRLFAGRYEGIFPRLLFKSSCSSTTGSAVLQISDFREGLDDRYITIISGRPLSKSELNSERRVCLLPEQVSEHLFGNIQDAAGSTLLLDGIPFKIHGVYKPTHNISMRSVLIPFGTAMSLHGGNGEINAIDVKMFLNIPAKEKYKLKDDIRSDLYAQNKLDPADHSAFRFEDQVDFVVIQERFLNSIRYFTGILGVLSLLMGIIGVSSLIHLSVRERTREIAIRTVCGSSRASIFALVLGEAVMTMLLFGFVGMILASTILEIGTDIAEKMNEGAAWIMIGDMSVTWSLALISTLLIIICGLIAGFAPARKAVSLNLTEALNLE